MQNPDRMKYRPMDPDHCADDALNELFSGTWSTTEVEELEEIERTGRITVEDLV